MRLLKGRRFAWIEDDKRAVFVPVEWFDRHREARVDRHWERSTAVDELLTGFDVPLDKVACVGRGIPMLALNEQIGRASCRERV